MRIDTFLNRFTEWEANLLDSDGPWFDEMPEETYEGLMELQAARNELMEENHPMTYVDACELAEYIGKRFQIKDLKQLRQDIYRNAL